MSGRAGGFSVTVSVIDAATKRLEEINKSLERVHAPTERLQRQFSKLAENSGMRELGKGMREFGRSSLDAFENVGRLVAPLGAITGGASIAGIMELAHRWAELGSEIEHTATRAGMSAGQLSALQGAARLAGSSAEGLSSGMKTLNDNLFNAAAGRAPEAMMAFSYLGISVRDMTGHVKTATEALPEVADKIAAIKNPTLQAQIATMAFGGAAEDLLPFLRRGRAGIDEYTAAAKRYGSMSDEDAAKADDLRRRQTELALAVTGLSNAFMADLEPAMAPMLHDMSEWIASNREVLGQDIASWIKATVPEVISFARGANDVVQALGGWKPLLEGVIAISLGGWAVSTVAKLAPLLRLLALIPGSGITGAALAAAGIGAAVSIPAARALANTEAGRKFERENQLYGGGLTFDPVTGVVMGGASPTVAAPQGPGFNPNAPNGVPPVGPAFGSQQMAPGPASLNRDISHAKFIRQITPLAEAASKQTGVDARVIMAQAALESGWGQHTPGNNYFGIKGPGHTEMTQEFIGGRMVTMPQSFAGYRSVGDSFQGYADFINKNPRYAGMKGAPTIDAQIAALGQSGYATDPQYASKIAGIAHGLPAQVAGGAGAAPPAQTTTVRGSADLNIKLDGFPLGTRTTASTTGDLFSGAPKIDQAMAFQ